MENTLAGKQKLLDVLYEALAEVNLELIEEDQLACEPGTVLFGRGASIDSMDLVRLVVLYEQKINEIVGSELSLTDDRAMSQQNSPFQTVGSLVDYADHLLKEEADGG